MSKFIAQVDLVFIRGGLTKANKPYLCVSNGRSEFFINITKSININNETFDSYEEGDHISLEVEILPGSDSLKLVSIV